MTVSMTKAAPLHTPGPWEIHEGVDYIVVLRGDETTEQGIIVDNIGDAMLVAAAPDLLKALQGLRDTVIRHNQRCESATQMIGGGIHDADEAIAKAQPR